MQTPLIRTYNFFQEGNEYKTPLELLRKYLYFYTKHLVYGEACQ